VDHLTSEEGAAFAGENPADRVNTSWLLEGHFTRSSGGHPRGHHQCP